jgi:serine protease
MVQLANRFGATHLVADVVGWIPDGAGFTGITPERVLDTRGGGAGALGPDTTRALSLAGTVPADATAVALNVTITEPTAATFITAWPAGVDRPTASSLNAVPGQTRPAMVIVKLGSDQTVNLFNRFGSSHLVADLVGWYATPTKVPLSLLIGHGLAPSAPELEPGRPLAAMADGDGRAADFVANELIFVGTAENANAIAAAWYGTVVQSTDSLAGLDPVHVIRFDLAAIDTAALPDLAATLAILSASAEGAGSALQVSDANAAKLLQLQAELLAAGHAVAINPLTEPAGYSDGLILEEAFDMDKDGLVDSNESFNAFDWTYLREGGGMDHGFTSAWQQLDTYGRLRPAVEIAVFDGGFFDSDDLGPMTLVGTSYGSSNLASCTGGNPCPWHGTGVAGTIYGTHNNSIGTAGGATPVISEMVAIGVGRDIVDVLWGLLTIGPELYGSKALNISAGGRIPVLAYAPLYLVLAPIALGVHAVGLQIVASAGNEGANVDDTDCFIVCWESGGWIPCELPGVICVGGLQLGTVGHAANSNYGHEDVDIWASYTVKIGPAPDQVDFRGDPDPTDRTVNGTSFSAPLVTAALALTAAAHPGMSGPDAGDLLIDTARPGSDRVKRILDVQAAVNDALISSAPFVRLTYPPPGGSLVYGGEVTLKAAACCTTATFEWREGPRGGSLTTLATGQNPTLRLTRPPGLRTLEVRATFAGGVVKTERIDYTITNQAPTVTMHRPLADEQFFQSQDIPLRATSFDEAYNAGLPDANYSWSIDSVPMATGAQTTVTGLSVGTHTVQVTVTDGNKAGTALRTFEVVADPPNPPPQVAIGNPNDGQTAGNEWGFFDDQGFHFTATAVASDTAPDPNPTIEWYWRPAAGGAETHLGGGPSINIVWGPDWQTARHLIARVSDGVTTVSDFVTIFPLIIG